MTLHHNFIINLLNKQQKHRAVYPHLAGEGLWVCFNVLSQRLRHNGISNRKFPIKT